jgi:hypothetical protein
VEGGVILRIGTILRLPWIAGQPRAVVAGLITRGGPSRVRLLGLEGTTRGRVMILRRSRVERRAKDTGCSADYGDRVPCPCGENCRGNVYFDRALSLLKRLA